MSRTILNSKRTQTTEFMQTQNKRRIQTLACQYAKATEALAKTTEEIRQLQLEVVQKRYKKLQRRREKVDELRETLTQEIASNSELFDYPRTRTLFGVKLGLRKCPGHIEGNASRALHKIKQVFPKRLASQMIRVREELDKPSLVKLDSRQLASVGLRFVQGKDKVVLETQTELMETYVLENED